MPERERPAAEASQSSGGAWLSLTNNTPGNTSTSQHGNTDDNIDNDEPTALPQPGGDETDLEQSQELTPPPLPPRPPLSQAGSLRLSKRPSRPQLLATPTTSLSLADVQVQTRGEVSSLRSSPASKAVSRKQSYTHFGRFVGSSASDGDDSASIRSHIPALDARVDNESILGDVTGDAAGPEWTTLGQLTEVDETLEALTGEDAELAEQVEHEFDEIPSRDDTSEGELVACWKSKLKHFFILSASGKPVYSRHGDDQLISHYVGVAQTLISFYQDVKDPLKGFTAGSTRFVILSKGPLNLVAISRLPESDAQLRNQLEALYMQILSTLTLPSMEKMFSHRPSTDLRRSLEGTDVLLDGLSDGFTRGSPSTLLSALECLRLRKTHRKVINDTLLKSRTPNLLYGLLVAAGRLVSVVRPKKHSLHPGDLHLIFNMLFAADSIRAGGGENWIPLCLPGFNSTGYLYMYVSFIDTANNTSDLATILISANKESFFELRQLRDTLLASLQSSSSLQHITTSITQTPLAINTILPPSTPLRHFLYKSRGNVQFVQPSLAPYFSTPLALRRLMNLYAQMHESIHSRTSHLKVQHVIARDAAALAWETPLFELYVVAGPGVGKEELVKGANRVVQWIRREEERVFIIGGAVF